MIIYSPFSNIICLALLVLNVLAMVTSGYCIVRFKSWQDLNSQTSAVVFYRNLSLIVILMFHFWATVFMSLNLGFAWSGNMDSMLAYKIIVSLEMLAIIHIEIFLVTTLLFFMSFCPPFLKGKLGSFISYILDHDRAMVKYASLFALVMSVATVAWTLDKPMVSFYLLKNEIIIFFLVPLLVCPRLLYLLGSLIKSASTSAATKNNSEQLETMKKFRFAVAASFFLLAPPPILQLVEDYFYYNYHHDHFDYGQVFKGIDLGILLLATAVPGPMICHIFLSKISSNSSKKKDLKEKTISVMSTVQKQPDLLNELSPTMIANNAMKDWAE